jgi:hypothetical protein
MIAQDDQIFNADANCTWMADTLSLYRKHPRLGAMGHRGWCDSLSYKRVCMGYWWVRPAQL